jgi:hypothetical protein
VELLGFVVLIFHHVFNRKKIKAYQAYARLQNSELYWCVHCRRFYVTDYWNGIESDSIFSISSDLSCVSCAKARYDVRYKAKVEYL